MTAGERGRPEWLVSIPMMAMPPEQRLAPVARLRFERLRRSWERHMQAPVGPADGDPQDWAEMASRLEAAVAAFGIRGCWVTSDHRTARNLLTGRERPVGDLSGLPLYGPLLRFGDPSRVPPAERLADRYAELRTFAAGAGRRVRLCSHGEDSSTLIEALLEMAGHGAQRAVVKVTLPKYGSETVGLHRGMTRSDVESALLDALGFALVHLDGMPGAYLVQEHVPMRFEYRLFVVAHRVVAGAGCIEERTPLDRHPGDGLDPAVRDDRSDPARPVRRNAGVAARLAGFGRQVAAAIRDERPGLHSYVLDVALGRNAQPLVVELNGLLNAGLYASDPRRVTAAMQASRGLFLPRPSAA